MKKLFVSLVGLGFFYLLAIFADFFAPYPADREDRTMSYCPPYKLRFYDGQTFYLRPFVYPYRKVKGEDGFVEYREDHSRKWFVHFFRNGRFFSFDGDKMIYLLGADLRGRDLLSRMIYGARISLSVGIIGVAISFSLGLLIGGIAGYYGGIVDMVIMRICELVMLIPAFYLMLSLRAVFPINMDQKLVYLMIVVIMSLIGWASLSRVIRGQVLSISQKGFVLSAKAIGMPDLAIIVKHILPHTFSYVIVAITLSIPGYILGESALSLIGLGIQDPYVSWGSLLSSATNIAQIWLHPWLLFPGGCIFVVVFLYNLLGDALRDVLDASDYI